ncbi:hypothetical protein MJL81_28700, partial [Salmonella enterica subsp. enterica serovar Anatum]|nr:hypothetical protein [Salmonella enterica subsp. enterica serovar Anatum]
MNIIAIMGPHGVYYKDEPIKELERALQSLGFQIIWPQNSVDLRLQWLSYLLWPIAVISVLLVFGYFFSTLANWIAAPFNGLLAE